MAATRTWKESRIVEEIYRSSCYFTGPRCVYANRAPRMNFACFSQSYPLIIIVLIVLIILYRRYHSSKD